MHAMHGCVYVKPLFNLFRYSTLSFFVFSLDRSVWLLFLFSFSFTLLCPCSFIRSFRFVSFVLFGVFCLFNIRKFCSMRECVSFLSLSRCVLFRGYTMNSNSTLNNSTTQSERCRRVAEKRNERNNAYSRLTLSSSTFTIDEYEITGFSSFCSLSLPHFLTLSFNLLDLFDSIGIDVIVFLANFANTCTVLLCCWLNAFHHSCKQTQI